MSASFAPECTDAKRAYDNCFNEWYSESKSFGKILYETDKNFAN